MNRPVEHTILFTICICGAIGITPFAVYRLMQAQWLVGAIDLLLVGGMLILALDVWRSGQARRAGILLSFLANVAVLGLIYLQGPFLIFWAYPAMLGTFYLLKPREALVSSLLVFLLLGFMLYPDLPTFYLLAVLVSLFMNGAFAFVFASRMGAQHHQVLRLSREDALTGVGNRRAMDEKLDEVHAAHARAGLRVSLLLLDLDHFKLINDTYGHNTGDRVLQGVTRVVAARLRTTDSLYRFGGEEFAVVALGTPLQAGARLAEALRIAVAESTLLPDHLVSISLGVAELGTTESCREWIRRCDIALYEAKHRGRNQVFLAPHPER